MLQNRPLSNVVALILLVVLLIPACDQQKSNTVSRPPVPEDESAWKTTRFPDGLREFMQVPDGDSIWFLSSSAGDSTKRVELTLSVQGPDATWHLQPRFRTSIVNESVAGCILEPQDHALWHAMHVSPSHADTALSWLPLRRMSVESVMYNSLLDMLQELTTPRFEQIVRHWTRFPIPVRAFESWTNGLELSACLREAMDIWNEGQDKTLFQWDPDASQGIRMVHYPGIQLEPVLYVQATRLETDGTPRVVQIRVGDNYARASSRRYAVRGMAHELGHCLFLWGHTRDRVHLLWGSAPPLVDQPSTDERRCVSFLLLLPAGFDLSRYH